MAIQVSNGAFRINTANTSYWFRVTKFGHLEHLYYGPRLPDDTPAASAEALAIKRSAQPGNTVAYDQSDLLYALDVIPLEWSSSGYGDYRYSPIEAVMPDGAYSADFCYVKHKVVDGPVPLDGLPQAHGECQSLIVVLLDWATNVRIDLVYTVFEATDVITRRVSVMNGSPSESLSLRRLMSVMVDLPNRNFDVITFDGGWIKEANRHDRPLQYGQVVNSSATGASSNRHNPGFLLAERGATQQTGWVYGFNLVYSGNHLGLVELSNQDQARVTLGINPHCFEWNLLPGETFDAPEAVLTFSPNGFNGASHNFHGFVNRHIVPERWAGRERPVLLNNWEAHFFTFNEKKLLELARGAKDLGVELFVLDDGWFGKRNSDTSGLGDYTVNRKKLPSGLAGFGEKINALGLDFGLWFEPEMVNEDSDLYRLHPEWAVRIPGRRNVQGRNQFVLDLANPDVQEYIIEQVSGVLDSAPIAYVKWDMNRHISDAWSPTCPAGEFYHRYQLGLHRVLSEIFGPRPEILLESCSSGGNRFDLGMLCHSPQIWASDDTDPIERLKIQGGLSYLYPPSTMGAHISQAPHQQTLRHTPLSTRFNVAAFGVLGYELDLKNVTRLEKKEIAEQIAWYKRHRNTLQFGRFSRLDTGRANQVAWQVVSPSSTIGEQKAIAGFFQTLASAYPGFDSLRVLGLDDDRRYRVETRPQHLYLDRFGELLKHITPIELKPDGAVLRLAGKFIKLTDAVERYEADGVLLASGLMLNSQFLGSNYTPETRLLGDFGSALYLIEETP